MIIRVFLGSNGDNKSLQSKQYTESLNTHTHTHTHTHIYIYIYIYIHTWSELMVPMVNMIKEGCENKSALLILLNFYLKKSQKSNLSLEHKNFKWGEISL